MKKLDRQSFKKFQTACEQDFRQGAETMAQVIIGMGSCCIAAGSRTTMRAFQEEIAQQELKDVVVKQTSCMGTCFLEPTVTVMKPGMPNAIYGNVSAEIAKKIVNKHLINGRLVSDYVLDAPAPDILEQEKGFGR